MSLRTEMVSPRRARAFDQRVDPRSRRGWWCARWWRVPLGVLVLLGLALASAPPARAEVRVEIGLEPGVIPEGETSVLSVTVTGSSRVDAPDIPDTPGLTFRSAGRSTSISIVNGRMTQSVAFNFLVLGDRPGQYTVGPVEVKDGGRAYRSGTASLTVADAGSASPGRGSAPGGAQGGRLPRPGRGVPGVLPAAPDDVPDGSGDLFARAVVDRDHVLVGEQVTLRFQVYVPFDTPVLNSQVANLPTSEGFWREDLLPQKSTQETVRGRPYQVTEFAFALFPTRAGQLEIGEGAVDLVIQDRRGGRRSLDPFGFFANYPERQMQLKSKALRIRVDALPEPRPADFTGGVGSFSLRGALERPETGQNEPVTLTLTVEGTGNVSTVGDPRLPEMPGVRTYPSGSDVQSSHGGDILRGTKTFKMVLVPESVGRREIPPIRVSIFDPKARKYVRLETPVMAYNVTASTTPSGGSGEVARTGRDLRTIRTGGTLRRIGSAEPWRSGGFWVLQGLPLLLVAGGLFLRTRRARREADWGGFLSRGAPGRLRRELDAIDAVPDRDPGPGYDRLDAALERYFTDRFHLPVRGLTREELAAQLTSQGVPTQGVEAARSLLDRCDFARFAPSARSASELQNLLESARTLPVNIETNNGLPIRKRGPIGRRGPGSRTAGLGLFLAFAGGLSLVAAAGSGVARAASTAGSTLAMGRAGAVEALTRGHGSYTQGDYRAAAEAYRAALASGYESPELYLDLGNACYKSGRLGWAVYWYERGRRLDPGDPDLATNLESILAETRDRTLGEGGSRFLGTLASLQARVSAAGAARWFTLAWILFGAWLAVRLAWVRGAGPSPASYPAFRFSGLALAVFLGVAAAGVLVKAMQASGAPAAVVVSDELPVRSNPDADATVEFTLHAGTRVRLGRTAGEFQEVLFSEKLHGWGSAAGLAGLSDQGLREAAGRP